MSRISELRRRDWTSSDLGAVEELTAALRTPGGDQRLRVIQAAAILEALRLGGVFLAARVGAGKTLVAALLATLFEDLRPLIIVPGGHEDKTEREFEGYRKHWQLSHKLQVTTYNAIARDVDEKLLRTYHPRMLICDEVDKLRRVAKGGSGTAARIAQWMAAYPDTGFSGMSGTMFKTGLTDYGHLVNWALKEHAPVPKLPSEILEWHKALKGVGRLEQKMLAQLGAPPGMDAREAFRDRFWHSPGIIVSIDCFNEVPLTLQTVQFDGGTGAERERLYDLGETPDGEMVDPTDREDGEAAGGTWAQDRRLALGFYHKPDPVPPVAWAKARRRYYSWVRVQIMSGLAKTELQARRIAIRAGEKCWLEWQEIEPTFAPRFRPVWLNTKALDHCKAWGQRGGIIWTGHRAFAERLSAETGWRWFAGGGLDADGMAIEQCPDRTVIASIQANSTGRNLQYNPAWCRGLVTALPGNGRDVEQLLGRQHREGQTLPVEMSILLACAAHATDLRKVIDLSGEEQDEMMRKNKVLSCAWR